MSGFYTEANYENSIIELFRDMGYRYVYAPDIDRDFYSPLYETELIEALYRLNSNLPEDAIKEAMFKLKHYENGELVLNFTPKLAKWLFDEGKATFRLLSTCDVTYVNNTGKDTYGADAAVVDKVEIDGKVVSTENKITGELAEAVRDGKVDKITVYFK